jgi:CheY-like chemotaxis protein
MNNLLIKLTKEKNK